MPIALPPACSYMSSPAALGTYVGWHLTPTLVAAGTHYFNPSPATEKLLQGSVFGTQLKITKDVLVCADSLLRPNMAYETHTDQTHINAIMDQISRPLETPVQQVQLKTPDPDICDNPFKNPFVTSTSPTSPASNLKSPETRKKSTPLARQTPVARTSGFSTMTLEKENDQRKTSQPKFERPSKTIRNTTPTRNRRAAGQRNPKIRNMR